MGTIDWMVVLLALVGQYRPTLTVKAYQFVPRTTSERISRDDGYNEKWGYTDVRQGAHVFWWLQYSTHADGYRERPLVMWLQGGPGVSSVGFGNFDIIGPIDTDLKPRNTTWLQSASLLFVDSPVGTGYSYVDNEDDVTTDIQEATDDLITLFKVFLRENPEFKTTPFYVFSQSYGGKFAVEFAYKLNQEIEKESVDCNLKGYALGNSWVDPVESITRWGPLLHEMSVVDEVGLEAIQEMALQSKLAAMEGRWEDSTAFWYKTQDVVHNKSNGIDWYNILHYDVIASDTIFGQRKNGINPYGKVRGLEDTRNKEDLDDIMNGPIRKKVAIVPDDVIWSYSSDLVFEAHGGDFMKDVLQTIDNTLNDTGMTVVVFQGQLDIICNVKAAMNWVQKLEWPGVKIFNRASRWPLVDSRNGQTDMYVKAAGRFKFYWNLRTGHSVASLMGDAALRMLNRIFDDVDR